MCDWNEINDLSNIFKKLQEDNISEKLSEVNCIEIINKLLKYKLVNFIFTTDGKEVITPKKIIKEIKKELFISGGRLNMVDLSNILKINFAQLQTIVNEIILQDQTFKLIVGQLISKQFEQTFLLDLNQKLSHYGIININELTKNFDLPGDYIQNMIRSNSDVIGGVFDEDCKTLYTQQYVNDQKAIIKGILSAISKPINLSFLHQNYVLNSNLLASLIDELITSKEILGVMIGNKKDKLSLIKFFPLIYIYLQKNWIYENYSKNKYIVNSSLAKMSVTDPKSYFNKIGKENGLEDPKLRPIFLPDAVMAQGMVDGILAELENSLNTHKICDIWEHVPDTLTGKDIEAIIELLCKRLDKQYQFINDPTYIWITSNTANKLNFDSENTVIVLLDDGFLMTKSYVANFVPMFATFIADRAKQNFESKKASKLLFDDGDFRNMPPNKFGKINNTFEDEDLHDRKEERKRHAIQGSGSGKKDHGGGGGSAGGAARGREHKTKSSTKKHQYGKTHASNEKGDQEVEETNHKNEMLEFGKEDVTDLIKTILYATTKEGESTNELTTQLNTQTKLEDNRLDALSERLADLLIEPFNSNYMDEYRKLISQSTNASKHETREEIEKYQEQINDLYQRLVVFDKGIHLFTNEKVKDDLGKYLLKTLGTELFGLIINYSKFNINQDIASESVIIPPCGNFSQFASPEARKKGLNECPESCKSTLNKLNKLLTQDVSAYVSEIETISQTNALNFMLKKFTKKQERPLILAYRHELVTKLNNIFKSVSTTDNVSVELDAIKKEMIPTAFHLIAVIAFIDETKLALHAPGKLVPEIIDYLTNITSSSHCLNPEIKKLLTDCQSIIIRIFSASSNTVLSGDNEREEQELLINMGKIKGLLLKDNNPPTKVDNLVAS